MARYSNVPKTTSNQPNNGRGGFSTDTSRDHYGNLNDAVEKTDIVQMIINSPTYQSALKLFSSLPDKSWLQQLQMIPTSFSNPSYTGWDALGLSNNYDDALRQAYQDAMAQIQQLVANYYAYNQSLPTTQVQQLADAGINSAVTGEGISSAERSTTIPQTSAVLPSTSPVDLLVSASNFITSTVGGFADLYSKFQTIGISKKQLGLSKDQFEFGKTNFMFELGKYLRENGITYKNDHLDFTYENLPNLDFSDPEGAKIELEEIFKYGFSYDEYSPFIQHLLNNDSPIQGFADSVFSNGRKYISFGNFGVYESVALPATTEAMYKIYKDSLRYQALRNSYDLDLANTELDLQKKDLLIKEQERQRVEFLRQREQYLNELIEKLHDSKNPADHALLQKILSGYNYKDITGQTIDNVSNVVSGVANVLF